MVCVCGDIMIQTLIDTGMQSNVCNVMAGVTYHSPCFVIWWTDEQTIFQPWGGKNKKG